MKRGISKTNLAWLLIIVMLILLFPSIRLLSVLGEEGYKQYDPALMSDAYNADLWLWTRCSCRGSDANIQLCEDQPVASDITISGGKIIHGLDRGLCNDGSQWSTTDVRLKDIKLNVVLSDRGRSVFSTNKGAILSKELTTNNPFAKIEGFVELTWNDYELGGYEIKVDGEVVQAGVIPEGQELRFFSQPYRDNDYQGSVVWENVRVREVFSCDLRQGEVRVVSTWDRAGTYDVSDLEAWKRFCPSINAVHDDGGLVSSSNRIFFSLVEGKSIIIDSNEYWEIPYIADRAEFGLADDVCEFYNFDSASCTGSVHECNNFVSGVGCVSIVENVNDLMIPAPSIHDTVVSWSSFGSWTGQSYSKVSTTLRSGKNVLLSTSDIKIHCDAGDFWSEYPGVDRKCVSINTGFGKEFFDGDEKSINPYLSVRLTGLRAQYRLDEDEGLQYNWVGDWELTFRNDGVRVSQEDMGDIVLDNDELFIVEVLNKLPVDGNFKINNIILQESVDEETLSDKAVMISESSKKTLLFDKPSNFLGDVKITSLGVLETDVGGVVFLGAEGAYSVVKPGELLDSDSSEQDPSTGFFQKLWNSFTNLINRLFRV